MSVKLSGTMKIVLSLQNNQNKYMKKVIIILAVLMFTGCIAPAQNFHGFFKSKSEAITNCTFKWMKGDTTASNSLNQWFYRPQLFIAAMAIPLGESQPQISTLSGAGIGISYGSYNTLTNYCNWSINASFLTQVNMNKSTTNIGGAISVDCWNKIMGIGGAYAGNKFYILTTVSYSF